MLSYIVTRSRALRLMFWAVLFSLTAQGAMAVSLIRDADIEVALRELARPIFNAAGLRPNGVRILIINDASMNAFVVDSSHVFINSGLVMRLGSAAQLQAVIAHEVAHISGGHISRRLSNMKAARGNSALGILLAIATAAAGQPDAAAGVAFGVQNSANRALLAHSRAEEASADLSAIRYLANAGIDPRAMQEVLDEFRGQEALSTVRQDPYVRGHPLTNDRIRAMRAAAASVPEFPQDKTANYWFLRAKGKLSAFLNAPSQTLRKIRKTDNSDIANMRRAVAYHRKPDPKNAVRYIDRALAKRPKDAFYHELKGQILLESRHFPAAVKSYERANSLRPNEPLILAGLGRSYLALKSKSADRRALEVLQDARARDPNDARLLRDLALAHARAGQNALASLATAERYAMLGRPDDARLHAERAAGALPEGSTAWRRARDIIHAAKLAQSERKRG